MVRQALESLINALNYRAENYRVDNTSEGWPNSVVKITSVNPSSFPDVEKFQNSTVYTRTTTTLPIT